MNTTRLKKLLILNTPYVVIGLYATKLGEAWRLAEGTDASNKFLHLMDGLSAAFRSPFPSFYPADLLIGIVVGCLLRLAGYEEKLARMAQLKQYALEQLLTIDGVVRIGNGDAPHILSVSLVGYPSANVVTDLGAQGICISAGSACHRGKLSHVYAAMKLDKKTAAGVLRVSFAPESTEADVDALVSALRRHRETRFPML